MLLQKIIVVIVGLVMSLVGALSPDLFAGTNSGSPADELAANTAEETLATLRTSNGEAFARVSVLWIEVDGRRVTEDAWGTGEVDEIRFKVGVKDVDGLALGVGDKLVPLHPTDIITVRMFRGDFSYRGIGTPLASVQLQGSVKTTVLHEGDVSNRVLTRVGEVADVTKDARPGDQEKVAYVVLTTGEKIDTVAVEDGGSRIFTEEVTDAAEAKDEPGNLLAKWVKIDGKLIREYTWGDGPLGKVEFEPAEGASRSIVIAFNGETYEVPANERVVVEDFVGEHLVYQVSGGMMRLRLDGYARAYLSAPALPVPSQGGEGAPLASFDFAPPSPKTTDTMQFRDRSQDDGIIVFRAWDFGDNSSSVLMDPTHRFEHPGTYEVRLTVTDNDLKSSNITRTIIVRNTEPVADFDYSPKIVSTGTVVAFTDRSYDPDGALTNWTWDFGDGSSASTRHPTHRFQRAGNVTVTLSVTDELGARTSLSKVIYVRNDPPLASFTYAGTQVSFEPIQFIDNSTDEDGSIVAWNWSFGDGRFGSGSAPVHAYSRPGVFVVSLTAYDDMGDADTASTSIVIGNRAPYAEFSWTPDEPPADSPISFSSQSSDPDGIILLHQWNFGDGTATTLGPIVSHTFPSAGTYVVTLTVTDNVLETSTVTRSVEIANSAPRASMMFSPSPSFRGVEVSFTDTSTDPDGDDIVDSTWNFGDGSPEVQGRFARHTYSEIGTFNVTLTVTDEGGNVANVTRQERVVNRPPVVSMDFTPDVIRMGGDINFTAFGSDPDLEGGAVEFYWNFSDGVQGSGPYLVRNFTRPGTFLVSLRGADSEGAVSAAVVSALRVQFALPTVNFSWEPATPVKGQLVNFSDESHSMNGPIREWEWTFGDNSGVASVTNPSHVYAAGGDYTVRLTATDILGETDTIERIVHVNLLPNVSFVPPTGVQQLHSPLTFRDTSEDPDGSVENWTWTFGDGTTLYDRHPTHPGYAFPGAYEVRLTIRDNEGATNTTKTFVNVANAPPVAAFSRSPLGDPLFVGQPIAFDGTGSFDPDGNPIQAYQWNMGDGNLRSGSTFSHSYTRSGRSTVSLVVDDGDATSARVTEQLTIRPDHDLTFVIGGRLPDGSPAAISLPPYAVSLRVGTTPLDAGSYLPVGDVVEASVDRLVWLAGDVVTVRIQAPFLTGVHERTFTVTDDDHVIFVNMSLRLAVTADLIPAGGDNDFILAFLGAQSSYGNDPLYTDMSERPHGAGLVFYADGTPAGDQRVDVEARWVPLDALSPSRNATVSPQGGSVLPNWCKVASATSAANGSFVWGFDGSSACYLNGIANGIYPVGRWEVRARPQVATAENRLSDIRAFYVDPTGGLILQASLGLA